MVLQPPLVLINANHLERDRHDFCMASGFGFIGLALGREDSNEVPGNVLWKVGVARAVNDELGNNNSYTTAK